MTTMPTDQRPDTDLVSALAEGDRSALDQLYQRRRVFARRTPPFSWLAPGRRWAPPDWLYPSPRITMYYEPRASRE